ncbi:glutamate-rich protein 5 [Oenanthe melanoleuca]|uniref:glutamate-rich protein 5 n=1 Tax=Oenanthe melanoleuca TaxID=2939378 RepID=UPI0024C0EA35|nr:glutamate-rich protein 5 [Oenanthe melanoleuca]
MREPCTAPGEGAVSTGTPAASTHVRRKQLSLAVYKTSSFQKFPRTHPAAAPVQGGLAARLRAVCVRAQPRDGHTTSSQYNPDNPALLLLSRLRSGAPYRNPTASGSQAQPHSRTAKHRRGAKSSDSPAQTWTPCPSSQKSAPGQGRAGTAAAVAGLSGGGDLRLHRRAPTRLRSSVLPGGRASRAPTRPDPTRPSGAAAEPARPAMGCSSSARSRPQEPPPLPASSCANTLTADDHVTAADQTQSDPAEHVSLASEETSPDEQLPGEEAPATILDVEGNTESVSKREEPEGTEPLPAGEEDSSELPSVWREESRGPSPPAPGEDAGAPSPGAAEDSGLAEGSDSSVVEVIEKVHITEEEHLTEGETGEQVETELLSETVSEGPETKEEETGEAVDSAAATEIGMLTEEGRTT